jgi:hypothetical protein
MNLPLILRIALRMFLRLRADEFDDIAAHVAAVVRDQAPLDKPGVEKARTVIDATSRHVPTERQGIAGQIIRLLIEIYLILRTK